MWKNREFKEKDEVIHIEYGKGVVISADDIYGCPIDVQFKHEEVSFYLDGKEFNNSHLPSIFHTDNNPFELAGKYLEMQQAGKQHPTETPIEELKEGQSVWAKAGNEVMRNGERTDFMFINEDDYVVFNNGFSVYKKVFYDNFTTINPNPTPTPKINRAELLEVASRAMEAMVSHGVTIDIDKDYPFQTRANTCVCIAKALINEVDKECK